MKAFLFAAALAAGLCVSAFAQDKAQQGQPQRDPEVDQALQRAYPGAQTQIMGAETINGVKVFDVNVATAAGGSTARVTEFGDFLYFGAAQKASPELTKMLQQNVGSLFKAPPSDVELFHATSYYVDVPAPPAKAQAAKGKQGKPSQAEAQQATEYGYRVRLDAVGRVLNIKNPDEVRAAYEAMAQDPVKDEAIVKQVTEKAKPYLGDLEIAGVFKMSDPNFYFVDAKGIGTYVVISQDGQLASLQRGVTGKELPQPVRVTIDQMFANASRSFKGEDAFFQFDQQAGTGNAVTVKMRPTGDILEVINDEAAQEAKAVTAKHKQGKSAAPPAKPGA